MHKTLTTEEIACALASDQYAGFSYQGGLALAAHLENCEQEVGEQIELDIVAIRSEYTEYSSAWEAAKNRVDTSDMVAGESYDDGELNKMSLKYLRDRTTVIEFEGGIIVQDY